ncbi:extracellular solute-binding protein [Paenibacillus alkaliterrae]|uniref:extracellular solute-binding protein n=1 Tax=Paenibacillus alkaliterrae TaxID=320909 RepID=UPI001F364EE5|nr:extracellular solute-binding protein [Paenibacillus alkaliterrae]MCF2939335.1 extracellular solute-binding protein [Paenibacillus alkaliterrae]
MSPGKYVPLVIGALLLAAMLLVQFSRNADPASLGKPDGKSNVQPVEGEPEVDQLTEIHVNVSLPADQFHQLVQANQNFMMKYSYIQVLLTNEASASKAYELWTRQSQQGIAADVMLLDNGFVKPFAVHGFLQSADSLITGDSLSDHMPGLLDPLKWNGYLWGMPRDVNPYIVVWNGSLLKKAGLQDPPTDWSAYQAAAAKAIEIDPGTRILNWSIGDLKQQLGWLAAFQSEHSNLINMRHFNEIQMEQLRWLQTMENHISLIKTEAADELNEAFLENKLLAAVLPWNTYEKLSESVRKELIVDRDHIYYPWLNGRSYVISSNSKAEEEAMLWIGEMTDVHHQQLNYERFGQLPVSASLYTSNSSMDVEQDQIPPAWWRKLLEPNQPDDQLPLPDPLWAEKWQYREEQWQLYSKEGFELGAYIEALHAG